MQDAWQLQVIDALTNIKLFDRDRVTVAWFRASRNWHSVEEYQAAFHIRKNGAERLRKLWQDGYLQREQRGKEFFYAVAP